MQKTIKMHLEKSLLWKEAQQTGQAKLTETHWNGQSYIGSYFPAHANYNEIQQKEQEIKTLLQLYCPKLILDKQTAYLFPQIFFA